MAPTLPKFDSQNSLELGEGPLEKSAQIQLCAL